MRAAGGEALVIGERLIRAIEAGDAETLRTLYAPGVRVWHAHDGREQDRDENMNLLAWMSRNVKDLRYTHVRRERSENGFVQQHVLCGTTSAGEALEVPACLVVRIESGKIVRIDEYFDSATLAPLRRAPSSD